MPDNVPILALDRELEPQDPFAIVDHWLARYDRMDGAPRSRSSFTRDATEAVLARHRAGDRNLGSVIWVLLMSELWC